MNEENLIKNLISLYEKVFLIEPSFEDLLKDCIKLRGVSATEFLSSSLQEGWVLNGGEELDFTAIYNKYFGYDRLHLYEKLEEIEFNKHKQNKEVVNDDIISSDGTVFDKFVWGTLEEIYKNQHHLSGFITNVYENNYEVTFDIADVLFIPKEMDLEYPKIKGFVPKEKYKHFKTLTIEQFKNIKYDVKILFIEKSSKTLILKPCNYKK